MKRSDIDDYQVCMAYQKKELIGNGPQIIFADQILAEMTGAPLKVAYAAMMRAEDRGYIDCGVSLKSGWLTEKGRKLVEPSLKLHYTPEKKEEYEQWIVVIGEDLNDEFI